MNRQHRPHALVSVTVNGGAAARYLVAPALAVATVFASGAAVADPVDDYVDLKARAVCTRLAAARSVGDIVALSLIIVGLLAKLFFKINYLHICGLLAGSMTSPSLAFTQTMTSSEAPAVAFATVYPLTMILRVIVAQLMILIFR